MNNVKTFLEEENIKNYIDQSHKDEMSRLIKDYVDDYDDALMFYFILLFGIFTNLLLLFFLFSPLSSDHRSSCKYIC